MDITGLKKQRELIIKKKDNIEYERKRYLEEYSELKDKVKKTGLISLVCLVLQIIFAIFLNGKSPTLLGIAKLSSPFVLAILIGTLIIFLSKGFVLFVNADTEWSKKLADKLERTRFAEVLDELNSTIIKLDVELDKLNNKLESAGVDVDALDVVIDGKITDNKTEKKVIKNKAKEKGTNVIRNIESKKSEVKKSIEKNEAEAYEQKASDDVDDLLSALDSFGFDDDDDDEFENSSEIWKKDSKMLGK